jgi:hypothetical protein
MPLAAARGISRSELQALRLFVTAQEAHVQVTGVPR